LGARIKTQESKKCAHIREGPTFQQIFYFISKEPLVDGGGKVLRNHLFFDMSKKKLLFDPERRRAKKNIKQN
jgi:hypothetical protein